MSGNTHGPLTFGFDIGIASVGWCVLGENRIVNLGVRCFDKAETAKEGESLNLARRTARLMRRRLRRRAWRLTKLARLLKREGLIAEASRIHIPSPVSPWRLRVEGIDRRLTDDEWARVIYHLCKHRGFHWISRAEERKAESDAKEGGRVKKGLSDTQRRMTEKGYRSAAEMVLAEFPDAQRNKQGDYGKALSRILLSDELALLFRRQRELGNPNAGNELEATILGNGNRKSGLFWEQKPPLAGADLLKMLGRCTFEKNEYRAPKASFTAERHVWLTRLNNLRVVVDGTTRSLDDAEHRLVLPLPYKQAGDFTYKQLRTALTKAGLLPEGFKFAGLSYPTGRQLDDPKAKDPESEKLVRLPAWQELRKTLKDKNLETEWEGMAGAATGGNPELLDEIARVLSVFKDGDEVTAELWKLPLPGGKAMIDALSEISFDKFHALSLKALRKIVPHMESGLRYDEACAVAGYHHSQLHAAGAGEHKFLPPFYSRRDKDGRMVFNEELDVPRNPVVLRALNQARKVLNALVRTYGSPTAVHIEMARDLSRPLDERNKVKKAQDEYRERNEKDKAAFAAEYGIAPKSREFEKFQLYREQQGKCAYSLKSLDLHRVLHDIGYAEVDHALPYSRSYDDSKNNKVLALTEENRNKGNRTAYEYLTSFPGGENGERWRNFSVAVETNKAYRLAKRTRLLRKDFSGRAAEEFRERNLNDTRYICRFFKNTVERFLKLDAKVGAGDTAEISAKRCVVLSGQTTAFLRARWGLLKVRGNSDRHHALDAAVVAACSHGMVKRLGDYSRTKELAKVHDGFPDPETGEIIDPVMFQQLHAHFPDPWPHFRAELEARLNVDDTADLRARMELFGTYAPEALETLRPLFVSRAPQRRNSGAAHKDTIYAQPERLKEQGGVTQKVPLTSLTLKDLDKLIDPHRNEKLYAAIRARLEAHGGKADKAFPAGNPLRKPDREGNPTGPVVRTVTMVIDKLSGIPVRGGIAKNDTMLRVDIFRHKKDGKFHLVPVYVYHAVAKEFPNRAIVQAKDEDEWTLIDDKFDFCFSAHPNDLLKITQKSGETIFGYYRGCHSGTAAINIALHDRYAYAEKTTSLAFSKKNPGKPIPNDKLGLIEGIGVKMAANMEKFHVDTLGNIYPAPPEQRRGLA
ncbi:type II CRISPR RNA-guided endonuclease Cas9 [Sulfuritalea hydrogenivorans]|uniref:CRISPR-associated endonuclease Cas9 n=1 Tax=Sulfuritalea hydrogenivorans sk43H TaxID=1223802 RepID=W0SDH6_9PROT|nr:type II CRISPR RNA-guided endonuclease Cas9 [Sulfuritalea hydrogenivorans]MDK9713123.1 type II CRISPR RNA-guided endonuclease Cas9 [Sulfuritalea sp.]BAO29121.1 crispr-associated protein, csn1 family [Sulfuritalea hydrogenivorans sk43H]